MIGRPIVHGHNRRDVQSSTHRSWSSMIRRCRYPSHDAYPRYGGRGIMVCDRWLTFESFLTDMGERPEGTTIDRIDNDGNYEPSNCRWATREEQANKRSTSKIIEHMGRTQTMRQWAIELGVDYHLVANRINRGWSPHRALTAEKRSYGEGE